MQSGQDAAIIVVIAARGVARIGVVQPFIEGACRVHKVADRSCGQVLIWNGVAIGAQAKLQTGPQPNDRTLIFSVGHKIPDESPLIELPLPHGMEIGAVQFFTWGYERIVAGSLP
jgi:hypothetical protein